MNEDNLGIIKNAYKKYSILNQQQKEAYQSFPCDKEILKMVDENMDNFIKAISTITGLSIDTVRNIFEN